MHRVGCDVASSDLDICLAQLQATDAMNRGDARRRYSTRQPVRLHVSCLRRPSSSTSTASWDIWAIRTRCASRRTRRCAIAHLIKGAKRAKLARRPAPDKWSVSEILAHLSDAELVAGHRMRRVLGARLAHPGFRSGPLGGGRLRQAVSRVVSARLPLGARMQARAFAKTETGAVEAIPRARRAQI